MPEAEDLKKKKKSYYTYSREHKLETVQLKNTKPVI